MNIRTGLAAFAVASLLATAATAQEPAKPAAKSAAKGAAKAPAGESIARVNGVPIPKARADAMMQDFKRIIAAKLKDRRCQQFKSQ